MFVASSSVAYETNFRFRVQICDGDGFVLREFRNPKDPTYGTLYFDPHRTIETYLSYDISNLIAQTTGWQTGVNTFKDYYINVAEEYGPSGSISVGASSNSNVIKAVNSAEDFANWGNHSINNRRVVFFGSDQAEWLTNQPSRIPIRIDDSYELGTITDTGSTQGVHRLQIQTYNAAGTLLKTAMVNNPYGSISTVAQQFLSILVGPADLNLTTLSTGSQPLIEDDTAYYTVDVINSFGTQKTQTKRFDIDWNCTRDSYDRLYWLNPLGRFDAFNFTQVKDDTIKVEQSKYSRLLGVKTATTFTYTPSQVESSVFHSMIRQSYRLRSGFVNTETASWLKELIASPRIYMIIDGEFIPVNLKTSDYQSKKTIQEKLFNIEIEVELSVPSQRQRL